MSCTADKCILIPKKCDKTLIVWIGCHWNAIFRIATGSCIKGHRFRTILSEHFVREMKKKNVPNAFSKDFSNTNDDSYF